MTDIDDPWLNAYKVVDRSGKFEVTSASDVCILVCADRMSAEHYVTLLKDAYKAGHRVGVRQNSVNRENR